MAEIPEAADFDGEREVPLTDDTDIVVLPDQTADDAPDWSELREEDHELRLFEERPPHWNSE